MPKGTLYIFCGKMASGKTSLATQLSQNNSSILISEDVLLALLYPNEITDVSSYALCAGKLKAGIRPLLVDLLCSGVSVVLDFPANTVQQRKWIKNIVVQTHALYELHYLDCPNSVCEAQLIDRAIKEPVRYATDTVEMFRAVTAYFEPPISTEGFEITVHKKG